MNVVKTKLLLLALLAIFISSCGKDGEVGPQGTKGDTGAQGPQGPQGPQGQNGQDGKDGTPGAPGAPANVWSYLYTNQQITASTPPVYDQAGNVYLFSGYKNYTPANYQRVANTGLVLVYFKSLDGSWILGSYSTGYSEGDGPVSNITFSQKTQSQSVEVMGRVTSPIMDGIHLSKVKFDMKIILIEPTSVTTSSLRNSGINFEDIHEVEKIFHLD